MRLGIIINTNDPETAWNALRLGNTALGAGHEVDVFLMGSGVEVEEIKSERFDVAKVLGDFVKSKGNLLAGNYSPNPNAKPITIDQAADAVQRYLNGYYGGRLILTEVMDFAWNYYAEVEEKGTGTHAMELLVDKYTGTASPEPGPNMMWNTKYSMMSGMMGGATTAMPVTPERAKSLAQQFLDNNMPGLTVAEADTFYGYYTLHTLKNGQVTGMLSVNGYTGAIWYHSWHGPFIDMKEYD